VVWWRIEGLKSQLSARPHTDREILPYTVANGALVGLSFTFPPANPNVWDTLGGVVAAPLIVLGVLWAYRQNGGHAGRDFLQRYFTIGWVTSIRLLPVVLLAAAVLFVIKGAPADETLQTTSVDVLVTAALVGVYYQRVGSHMKQVAQGLPNRPLQPTSGAGIAVE